MEKIVLRKRSTRRGVGGGGGAFTIWCLLVLGQLVLAVMSLTPVFTVMTRYGTRPAASLVAFVAHQRNDPSMIRQNNEYHERKQTRLHAIEGLLGNHHPHGEPFSSNEDKENANKRHVVFEIHEETTEELLLSEEAAAQDAHDCSDPGMEAAAMERAVMLAAQLAHKKTEEMASSIMDDDDDA